MLSRHLNLLLCMAILHVQGQDIGFRFSLRTREWKCEDTAGHRNTTFPAISISRAAKEACYNLGEVFAFDDGNGDSTCEWTNSTCPNEWSTYQRSFYNEEANNSFISVSMSHDVFEGRVDPYSDRIANPLTIQLFDSEDCGETGDSQWHQWRACSEDIEECTELPYSVKSFRALQIAEGNDSCLVAAEEGEESKGSQSFVNLAAVFAFAVGISGIMYSLPA
ncbi:hypothetical protein Q7P37_009687 [Cladosporium fusiforme]